MSAAAEWVLHVPGDPVPWARAGRHGKRYYTKQPVAAHVETVRQAWNAAGRPRADDDDALLLTLEFVLAHPAGHFGTGRNAGTLRASAPTLHLSKPDIDNLCKLPLDALTGHLYRDDTQVTSITASKRWCDLDEQPHTTIVVREAPPRGSPLSLAGENTLSV